MSKKIAYDIMKAYDFDAFDDSIYMQYENRLKDTNYHLELNVFSEEIFSGHIEFYKKNNFFKNHYPMGNGYVQHKNGCTILKVENIRYVILNGVVIHQKEI